MTDNSKTTSLLNKTGFPFHAWCLETIRKLYKVSGQQEYIAIAEYPFTFPSTNGQLLGIHSSIDIVAITPSLNMPKTLILLVIECKKADDKIKNWIFISDKESTLPVFAFSKVLDAGKREDHYINRNIYFPKLGYVSRDTFDYAYQGIELNEKMTALNNNSDQKIYKALKQVNHGCRALEHQVPKYIEGLIEKIPFSEFEFIFYIPVVITTANLFIAKFDPTKVDSGEISKDDINYDEKKWVTYDFPLPDFIGFSARNGEVKIEKRTTFIVNDKFLSDFLLNMPEIQGIS